ncbi:GDSL-type esterase/lipase family protein [Pedobacter sp. Leaf176]|uniref:GDSL-type esterase/lipase family protein n=1 Tax=Pedobacter sp. Leaf176 TaxID=1736286 RepID=UPI0007016EB9|nr:GDSL-type esterase/lipase family protein [Pedobacter sp. Leaf176]KQR67465.1 GDSL family lipase [Pedobacter sp. Leaf176]
MYWYEQEVKQLEQIESRKRQGQLTLFYGSSTIRLWETLEEDFPERSVINLGFGGSTLAACVWFFERIMVGYDPLALVFYAGDNDLGDGRHPEEIFIFFQQLVVKVRQRFGSIPCYFVSLKPSVSRWHLADQFKYTNNLIESEIIKCNANWKFINIFKEMLDKNGAPNAGYYEEDGLHLSPAGYRLWKTIIRKKIG